MLAYPPTFLSFGNVSVMKITWLKAAGLTVALVMASGLAGCGGSSADLDEIYGLNDPENKRNPATPLVTLATNTQQSLRSPESTPAMAAGGLMENLGGFSADAFGDHAADFEKFKTLAQNFAEQAKSGASRSQLNELAQGLVSQAKQLEQKMASEE